VKEIKIREIEGFRIGSGRDTAVGTGCTGIICRNGTTGGVELKDRPAPLTKNIYEAE
jgi:L-aminopeptidase/D-esterase-like protein